MHDSFNYIGGGTPTAMLYSGLEDIIEDVFKIFDMRCDMTPKESCHYAIFALVSNSCKSFNIYQLCQA